MNDLTTPPPTPPPTMAGQTMLAEDALARGRELTARIRALLAKGAKTPAQKDDTDG